MFTNSPIDGLAVGARGLEPPSHKAYAPQAYVYTIPPRAHCDKIIMPKNCLIFNPKTKPSRRKRDGFEINQAYSFFGSSANVSIASTFASALTTSVPFDFLPSAFKVFIFLLISLAGLSLT